MARDKVGRSSEKGNERSKTTISDQPSRPPEGSIHHVTGGNQAVGASSNLSSSIYGGPLTRRPRLPPEDVIVEAVVPAVAGQTPLIIPVSTIKAEKDDRPVLRPICIVSRDPRQSRTLVNEHSSEEETPLESEIEIKQENNLDDGNSDPNWKLQFLSSHESEHSVEPENTSNHETSSLVEPEHVQAQLVEPETVQEQSIVSSVRVKEEPVDSGYENASSRNQQPPSVRIKEEPKDTDQEEETLVNEAAVGPPVEESVAAQVKEELQESDGNEGAPEGNDESDEDSDSDTIPYDANQLASPRASPSSNSDDTIDQLQDQNMEGDEEENLTIPGVEEEENEENDEAEDFTRGEASSSAAPPAVGFSSSRDLDEINQEIIENRRTVTTNGASSYHKGYSHANSGEESNDEEMPFFQEQETVDDDGDAFIQYPSSPLPTQVEDGRSAQKRAFSTDPDEVLGEEQPQKKSRFRADKYINPSSEPVASTSSASGESVGPSGPSSVMEESSSEQPTVVTPVVPESATEQPAIRAKVKYTPRNRQNMMIETMVKPAGEARSRQRFTSGSKPTSNFHSRSSSPEMPDFSNLILPTQLALTNASAIINIQRDCAPPQPDSDMQLVSIRDPRLRARTLSTAPVIPDSLELNELEQVISSSKKIRLGILKRVLKWSCKWLDEQKEQLEAPPILAAVTDLVPKMTIGVITTKFTSLQAYFKVFHPLMLHELWATMSKEYTVNNLVHFEWKVLIKSISLEGPYYLLQCSLALDNVRDAPQVDDLFIIHFSRPDGKQVKSFGVVEISKAYQVERASDVDGLLITQGKPNAGADFVIRTLLAPKHTKMVYSMSKICSISSAVAEFDVQVCMSESAVMCKAILNPDRSNLEVYRQGSIPKLLCLDSLQNQAYYEIATTILMTSHNSNPFFALIQGSPGTGKSEVLIHIMRHIINLKYGDVRHRILYCAPTDSAVDEATRRLLAVRASQQQPFNVTRVGRREDQHPAVVHETVEEKFKRNRERLNAEFLERPAQKGVVLINKHMEDLKHEKATIQGSIDKGEMLAAREHLENRVIELDEELESARKQLSEATRKANEDEAIFDQELKYEIISRADIICTTLDKCYNDPNMRAVFVDRKPVRPFLCCIIDDASQCTEPQSLFPLALGIPKIVLAGDIKQKPIRLNSSVAQEHKFDQSLFSRLHTLISDMASLATDQWNPIKTLEKQYRMDPEICKWPSSYFLGTSLAVTGNNVNGNMYSPIHAYRVYDVSDSCLSIADREARDFHNRAEVELVCKLVASFIGSRETQKKRIAVITFFESQKRFIRGMLQHKLPDAARYISVNLAEEFQGTEKDIVIVSCVLSQQTRDEKLFRVLPNMMPRLLTEVNKRLLTATTRSLETLIIVGHLKTLMYDEMLRDLIQDSEKRQIIRRASSEMHQSVLHDIVLKLLEDLKIKPEILDVVTNAAAEPQYQDVKKNPKFEKTVR